MSMGQRDRARDTGGIVRIRKGTTGCRLKDILESK